MPLFHEMTDQMLIDAARRCVSPTYKPLADRIQQRSDELQTVVDMLNEVAVIEPSPGAVVRARALLERLEEEGTMAKLRKPKARVF